LNNPLRYTDPDGDFIFTALALLIPGGQAFLPMAIAADIGMWSGGSAANGTMNPLKWDYSSGKTWGYMAGGAVIGGFSGGFGASIASSGGFMANTLGIMGGSFMNSVGMGALTGSDASISFGVASYNLTSGEWGYLGKKGNSTLENIGYGLGALANLKDLNDIINSTKAHLYTQTKNPDGSFDAISHSGIKATEGDVLMSYGPNSEAKLPGYAGFAIEPKLSTSNYPIPEGLSLKSNAFTVNKYLFTGLKAVSKFSLYQGATSNCVNWSSLGLWLNGIPNIGIHPFLLHGSMAIYNTGIYNALASQLTSYH
jgi:hypothetical protein